MVGLAVIVAALLGSHWAIHAEGLPAWRVRVALVLVAVVTFAGGRLHFLIANWAQFHHQWYGFRPSTGGLHAPGAIIGAVFAAGLVLPLLRLPFGRFADGLAPAVGVGIALARVGCFLHGCCYGQHCSLPWCVSLPADSSVLALQVEAGLVPPDASRSLPVHPLPLYFAAAGLGMTGFLLWLRGRKRYDGELGLVLLVMFSISSVILEPIRGDDPMRVYVGPWPQLLLVSIGMSALSLAALVLAEYRHRDRNRVVSSAARHP
jgi:phosphatidylglycerol:prolipoprotein diacylglycerol transferase